MLGVKNWGNADKIVYLLSPEYGRINAVAYGCRRPKSVLAAAMQPFSWLEIQLTKGERLDTVRQCEHKGFFPELYQDLVAMAYGSFICELAREISVEDQPQEEIYALLLKVLPVLTKKNPRICALAASFQLFEHTGLQLQYDRCVLCGEPVKSTASFEMESGGVICAGCEPQGKMNYSNELREFIVNLLRLDWENPQSFRVTGNVLKQGEKLLLEYIRGIFGKDLKSLEFIKQAI